MQFSEKLSQKTNYLGALLLFALGILTAAIIGFRLTSIGNTISLVWLPSGLAFAILFRFGIHLWPGILIGLTLWSVLFFGSNIAGIGGAILPTIEAVTGTWLLKHKLKIDRKLNRVRDVVLFFIFGVLIISLIPPGIGTILLSVADPIYRENPIAGFIEWWTGDAMGLLLLAPIILCSDISYFKDWTRKRTFEAALLFIILFVGITFMVQNITETGILLYPLAFIPFPLLMWAALRFGQPGASLAVILTSTIALVGVLLQFDITKDFTINVQLINLWSFMGLVAGTAHILAALNLERASTQQLLISQQQLIRDVIDNTDVQIGVKDSHGKYLIVNATFAEERGHTVDSLIGLHDFDLDPSLLNIYAGIPQEKLDEKFQRDLEMWRREEAQAIENPGNVIQRDYKIAGVDGSILFRSSGLFIRRKAIYLKDIEEYAVLIFIVQDDKLRTIETRLQSALEGGNLSIWELDIVRNEYHRDSRWYQMLGYEEGEFSSGEDLWQAVTTEAECHRVNSLLKKHLRGEIPFFNCEYLARKKNGESIWILSRGRVVARDSNGKPIRVMGTLLDITDRKQTENALEEAKVAAENANMAKSQFLANMSHEIRTPMNVVIGMTSVLIDEPLEDDVREGLETIRNAGDSLLSLINDILDMSKIESGKLPFDFSDFALPQMVSEVIELFRSKAAQKGLSLHTSIDPSLPTHLISDSMRLRQILVNLMDNAVKFTETGEVNLSVTTYRGEKSDAESDQPESALSADQLQTVLHFQVADTGIGIGGDLQKDIFEPFSQGDSSTIRRYGGSGLGLAISKRIAEAFGGTMWAESRADEGAVFHFTVRVGISNTTQERDQPSTVAEAGVRFTNLSEGNPCSILLAEDNPANQYLAIQMLKNFGYSIDTVANGREAVRAAGTNRYDLIFMDVEMPEMDGLQATREIRKRLQGHQLPHIIAITAYALPSDRQRCIDAGMNDFLPKPVTPESMKNVLLSYFAKRQEVGA